MKRVTLLLAMSCLLGTVSFGQGSNVNQAKSLNDAGQQRAAIVAITPALTHEKTAEKGKTWLYRGDIYKEIVLSANDTVSSIDPDALTKMKESYDKVIELEKATSYFVTEATARLQEVYLALFDQGGQYYTEEDYALAQEKFYGAYYMAEDTIALVNAASCADKAQNAEVAAEYYDLLITKYNAKSFDVFEAAYLLEYRNKNLEGMLAIIKIGLERLPANEDMKKLNIKLMIETGKLEEAKSALFAAIKEDPKNIINYTDLAYIYEEAAVLDSAEMYYNQALEADSTNFTANYRKGTIYWNKAKVLYEKSNNLPSSQYQKMDAIEKKAKADLRIALPYYEASFKYAAQGNDQIVIAEQLSAIYTRLRNSAKAQEYFDLAEKLQEDLDAKAATAE